MFRSGSVGPWVRRSVGPTGGSVYDVHITGIARAAGARIIVTDNRRHFLSALRHGLRVETPAEFLKSFRKSVSP